MISIPRQTYNEEHQDIILPPSLIAVRITRVDERDDWLDIHYILLLAPQSPQHQGLTLRERFSLAPAILGKVSALAKRLNTQERGEPAEAVVHIDPQEWVGKTAIVQIEDGSYKSSKTGQMVQKHQWKWGGYWLPDHPKAPADIARLLSTLPQGPAAPAAPAPEVQIPW